MCGYPWAAIYSEYFQQGGTPGGLEKPLLVEPYVGPLRVGRSAGRGRGLFLTRSARAGELLLCAEAVVAGPNEHLLGALRQRLEQSDELQSAVLCLVSDPGDAEPPLPRQSMEQLAKPSAMPQVPKPLRASDEELVNILRFNKYALAQVNTSVVPPEVTQFPDHSGLWLLGSFLNSSCCPNVQRVAVRDHLFVRAAKDLEEGAELFTCYALPLRPLDQRRAPLERYGFVCDCDRCQLEDAILDLDDVDELLLLAAKVVRAEPTSEEPVRKAEELVAAALEQNLPAAAGLQLPSLALPQATLSAAEVTAFRQGRLKPSGTFEYEAFCCQERLHTVLLGSFGHFLQAHAAMLVRHGEHLRASRALARLVDVLREVLPCSELMAATSRDMFHQKLLAVGFDWRKASAEFRLSLQAYHGAYGGGVTVWLLFNSSLFPREVLEAAHQIWSKLLEDGLVENERPEIAGTSVEASASLSEMD